MQILGNTVAWDGGVEIVGAGQIASSFFVDAAVASEGARNLADAVGAKVETDAGVFVANAARPGVLARALRIGADEGDNKFVGHSFVVGLFHALHRIGIFATFAITVHHGVERFGNALPAAVAVHGIVAATDRRNPPGVVLTHLLLQLPEVAGSVGGQSIAAIHEGVHEDAVYAIFFSHP